LDGFSEIIKRMESFLLAFPQTDPDLNEAVECLDKIFRQHSREREREREREG